MNALWVFLGGGLGSVLRYGISMGALKIGLNTGFPWATLLANGLACAFVGWLIHALGFSTGSSKHALLVIGFCGGLSTFSTFSVETVALVQQGRWDWAAAYVLLSLMMCLGLLGWMAYRS